MSEMPLSGRLLLGGGGGGRGVLGLAQVVAFWASPLARSGAVFPHNRPPPVWVAGQPGAGATPVQHQPGEPLGPCLTGEARVPIHPTATLSRHLEEGLQNAGTSASPPFWVGRERGTTKSWKAQGEEHGPEACHFPPLYVPPPHVDGWWTGCGSPWLGVRNPRVTLVGGAAQRLAWCRS